MSENTNAGGGETAPHVESFAINPVGEMDITVDGHSRFVGERDFLAYQAWAKQQIATLSAQSTGSGGVAAEPVAWAYEDAIAGYWRRSVSYERPLTKTHYRNIRPLYEHLPVAAAPTPPSGGGETETEPGRESIREILGRLWCFAEGQSPDDTISDAGHTVLCATLGGLNPTITRRIEEHTDAILKLLAPADRGETQAVGDGADV